MKIIAVVICLIACFFGYECFAQASPDLAALFQQLIAPATTDRATEQWLKLGNNHEDNSEARKYLVTHLPTVIQDVEVHYGTVNSKPWNNAVRLAGELKLVEAAPALAKWLAVETGRGDLSNNIVVRLEDNSPGKALAQIGDPSIPTLKDVLSHGNQRERLRAVYVLKLIASPQAKTALQEHVSSEPDPNLQGFIERILASQVWEDKPSK
jgi:hypothetical protein